MTDENNIICVAQTEDDAVAFSSLISMRYNCLPFEFVVSQKEDKFIVVANCNDENVDEKTIKGVIITLRAYVEGVQDGINFLTELSKAQLIESQK
jgi:hypothetical protein